MYRLATQNELKKVILDCGGSIEDTIFKWQKNRDNSDYQACYKRKGFPASGSYWSSSVYASNIKGAWLVYFKDGDMSNINKTDKYYVRCVSGRQ